METREDRLTESTTVGVIRTRLLVSIASKHSADVCATIHSASTDLGGALCLEPSEKCVIFVVGNHWPFMSAALTFIPW